MNTSCDDVKTLLSSYLDGELSEAQAAPVRSHLMACTTCRDTVQEGKVIRRWFQAGAGEPVPIPSGFAARVARRAFAGDPGLLVPAEAETSPAETAEPKRAPLLPFLLTLSAAAAVLLFVLSLLLREQAGPTGGDLRAEDRFWELEQPASVEEAPEDGAEAELEDADAARDGIRR